MLVLSPKDGTRARNRSLRVLDYEHEYHFIEHEWAIGSSLLTSTD